MGKGEITVGKGEIAQNEQFLLFPLCFLPFCKTFCHFQQIQSCCLQTLSVWKSLKSVTWERLKGPLRGHKTNAGVKMHSNLKHNNMKNILKMTTFYCEVGPSVSFQQKNEIQNQAKCKQNIIRPGKILPSFEIISFSSN